MFYLWALCALALGLATTGGCRKAPVPPPFDVPALIGLPIEALTQRMGAPDAANPGAPNPNQRTWTRNGATLTATFKPVSGRVTSLEMIARPAADAVRDGEQEKLLQAGRLSQSDARYSVDWIEAPERPLFYNGVKITPAPRTYQVQLRVTGSAELLQVSYQMSGATPPRRPISHHRALGRDGDFVRRRHHSTERATGAGPDAQPDADARRNRGRRKSRGQQKSQRHRHLPVGTVR